MEYDSTINNNLLYLPQYRVRIKRSPNWKKVKSAKSEIRIKRIWREKLKMQKSELNEVRIKRDQTVITFVKLGSRRPNKLYKVILKAV